MIFFLIVYGLFGFALLILEIVDRRAIKKFNKRHENEIRD
jgi:hypothetical protein